MIMKAKHVVFVLALVVGALVVFLIGRTPPSPADAFRPSDADKSRVSRIADVRTSGAKEKSPTGKVAKPVLNLSEIEDDAEKVATVELAMKVLTDEDQLDDVSSEYIGVDEKLAVESLLRIVEGGGSANGIAKAKETYEFVTGEEFVDRAAAEKWIAEEYEPPDPEDE